MSEQEVEISTINVKALGFGFGCVVLAFLLMFIWRIQGILNLVKPLIALIGFVSVIYAFI